MWARTQLCRRLEPSVLQEAVDGILTIQPIDDSPLEIIPVSPSLSPHCDGRDVSMQVTSYNDDHRRLRICRSCLFPTTSTAPINISASSGDDLSATPMAAVTLSSTPIQSSHSRQRHLSTAPHSRPFWRPLHSPPLEGAVIGLVGRTR